MDNKIFQAGRPLDLVTARRTSVSYGRPFSSGSALTGGTVSALFTQLHGVTATFACRDSRQMRSEFILRCFGMPFKCFRIWYATPGAPSTTVRLNPSGIDGKASGIVSSVTTR